MATLETQYKNFLINNPDSTITFEEWEKIWTSKYVNTMSGIEEYIHNIGDDLSDWDVTLMDGLENEPPYVSDDFQIGPDGAYEHIELDFSDTLKQLAIHLLRVKYTNGDLLDIGNEVGMYLGSLSNNMTDTDLNAFIAGLRHGFSHMDGSHWVTSIAKVQGDGC